MLRRMIGMDRHTGKALSGDAHLAQSLGHILSTPLGSCPMRRDYGSMLFELIDQPLNGAIRMLIHAASATAIALWEPRIKLTRAVLQDAGPDGAPLILIEGARTDLPGPNNRVSLTIPLRPLLS